MAKKKSFKGKKQYGLYATEGRYNKNLVAKLERHVRKHPEDEQAKAALKGAKVKQYARKAAKVRGNHPDVGLRATDAAGHILPFAWELED